MDSSHGPQHYAKTFGANHPMQRNASPLQQAVYVVGRACFLRAMTQWNPTQLPNFDI